MITQGATVTSSCEDCGGVLTSDTGQYIERGRLWWGTEARCASCSNSWCRQDSGVTTPEAVRQALLAEHGPARLRLSGDTPGLLPLMQALRETLRLSLGQARAMAAELKESGLLGTMVEMELLAAGLRSRSVAATVETGRAAD